MDSRDGGDGGACGSALPVDRPGLIVLSSSLRGWSSAGGPIQQNWDLLCIHVEPSNLNMMERTQNVGVSRKA